MQLPDLNARRACRRLALALALTCTLVAPAFAQADGDAGRAVRVLVSATDRALISGQIPGRIAEIAVRPGGTFSKGETLVRFDCAAHLAQREMGRAEAAAAKAQLDAQKRLFELNSISALDIALAQANVARARAQLKVYQVNVDHCEIAAPFEGYVVEWHAQPHESLEAGEDLLSIVGTSRLEPELIVPSAWLRWLKKGQAFDIRIDETGTSHRAEVRSTGAAVDAVSQTVTVYGEFLDEPKELLPGMSGTAVFSAN